MTQNEKHKIPVIGITGGVGSGKSVALDILEKEHHAAVIQADQVAHDLMKPGQTSYKTILEHFGEEILVDPDQDSNKDIESVSIRIDRKKLGAIVFADQARLNELNDITHKAVRKEILRRISLYRQKGDHPFIALEAALLIEGGYEDILDQLWYVYVSPQERIRRLIKDRGYSKEKCLQIFNKQLSDEEFLAHADVVIDNNGGTKDTARQIKKHIMDILNHSD